MSKCADASDYVKLLIAQVTRLASEAGYLWQLGEQVAMAADAYLADPNAERNGVLTAAIERWKQAYQETCGERHEHPQRFA